MLHGLRGVSTAGHGRIRSGHGRRRICTGHRLTLTALIIAARRRICSRSGIDPLVLILVCCRLRIRELAGINLLSLSHAGGLCVRCGGTARRLINGAALRCIGSLVCGRNAPRRESDITCVGRRGSRMSSRSSRKIGSGRGNLGRA